MNGNGDDKKLDWMYKRANSLVDREEYLLGKSVDKSLEQLNNEEKEKKLGLVPPKNHVEHECIPPSIRDFNKIVQEAQVDLSAKLQEDPLVAIKKREEEARREFLQNPIQLKKLQEALKVQEKNRKHKKYKQKDSDSSLDEKLLTKLKHLKSKGITALNNKSKSRDEHLNTILMHKFNQLKDKLSQEDLDDILAGKSSESEDDTSGKSKRRQSSSSSDDSEYERRRNDGEYRKVTFNRNDVEQRKYGVEASSKIVNKFEPKQDHRTTKRKEAHKRDSSSVVDYKRDRERGSYTGMKRTRNEGKPDDNQSKNADSYSEKYRPGKANRRNSDSEKHRRKKLKDQRSDEKRNDDEKINNDSSSNELEYMILQKLRMLRNAEATTLADVDKKQSSPSIKHYSSDDDYQYTRKTFGLVKADGTRIPLNRKSPEKIMVKTVKKVETAKKPDRKIINKLSDKEKEELRKQMMKDAEKREVERSLNLRRYREENEKEEKKLSNFDENFAHKELLKSTKNASVETRIKSNLNNIQRSSKHMNSNFSRRN